MSEDRHEPKRPKTGNWNLFGPVTGGPNAVMYIHISGAQVISDIVEIPPPEGKGLEYHISVAHMTPSGAVRPDQLQIDAMLRDFDMPAEGEDNHMPGVARHFWQPVHRPDEAQCHCFDNEKPHDEGGGFIWRDLPDD